MKKYKVILEVAGQYAVIELGYDLKPNPFDGMIEHYENSDKDEIVFRGSPADCYGFIRLNIEGYYGK